MIKASREKGIKEGNEVSTIQKGCSNILKNKSFLFIVQSKSMVKGKGEDSSRVESNNGPERTYNECSSYCST